MNKISIKAITTILVILLFIPCLAGAQENEKEETPHWLVTFYKVDPTRVDSLVKLEKKYGIPIFEENKKRGTLLERELLIHKISSDYNVVLMEKYPSWSAIAEGADSEAAFEAIEPDMEKRYRVYSAYKWVFNKSTHYDEIYYEASDINNTYYP